MRATNFMMNSDDNILSMYLKEINKIPLLTREEEVELATKAAKGDKAAKDKIIQANLRFVVNVAKKYQNHGLDLVDLISEGNIGLMTAIDRFDVSKGYHFISYAVWWIRQAILKAICEKSRMIRLPLNRANELVQIEQARKSITADKSEEEEMTQVAEIWFPWMHPWVMETTLPFRWETIRWIPATSLPKMRLWKALCRMSWKMLWQHCP